jgi:hypothetical protein
MAGRVGQLAFVHIRNTRTWLIDDPRVAYAKPSNGYCSRLTGPSSSKAVPSRSPVSPGAGYGPRALRGAATYRRCLRGSSESGSPPVPSPKSKYASSARAGWRPGTQLLRTVLPRRRAARARQVLSSGDPNFPLPAAVTTPRPHPDPSNGRVTQRSVSSSPRRAARASIDQALGVERYGPGPQNRAYPQSRPNAQS